MILYIGLLILIDLIFVDSLIGENSVAEIKCPFGARNTANAIDAVNSKMVRKK